MNKKLLLGIVAVLAIVAIVYFKDRTPEDNTNNTETPAQTQTISFTDSGYSPSSLTIPVGTKVVFKNDSSESMWPASGPHPTHTNYPEFDSKGAMAPGASYEFTFERAGNWPFHDHLNPNRFGNITVQ